MITPNLPLLPRIKQSPYLARNCPSMLYSSVCSIAMFINPSRQARIPRYSIPELSFTRTGRPSTDLRKSLGLRAEALDLSACANAGNNVRRSNEQGMRRNNGRPILQMLSTVHTHLVFLNAAATFRIGGRNNRIRCCFRHGCLLVAVFRVFCVVLLFAKIM